MLRGILLDHDHDHHEHQHHEDHHINHDNADDHHEDNLNIYQPSPKKAYWRGSTFSREDCSQLSWGRFRHDLIIVISFSSNIYFMSFIIHYDHLRHDETWWQDTPPLYINHHDTNQAQHSLGSSLGASSGHSSASRGLPLSGHHRHHEKPSLKVIVIIIKSHDHDHDHDHDHNDDHNHDADED